LVCQFDVKRNMCDRWCVSVEFNIVRLVKRYGLVVFNKNKIK